MGIKPRATELQHSIAYKQEKDTYYTIAYNQISSDSVYSKPHIHVHCVYERWFEKPQTLRGLSAGTMSS